MLDSISNYIATQLPNQVFAEFYQDYIQDMEKRVADHESEVAQRKLTSFEDVTDALSALNTLTEELIKL